jgi:hypothetical protein
MVTDESLELVKAQAFQLYIQQFPNINISVIANKVCKDRSRVSRWAKDGDWLTMAERLHQKAAAQRGEASPDSEGVVIDLSGAKTYDEVMDLMSDKASDFIEGQSFRFSSPNEILRFLEMAEKHRDRKEKEQDTEDSGAIIDSSLPEREAEALRAGMILINAAQQPKVSVDE